MRDEINSLRNVLCAGAQRPDGADLRSFTQDVDKGAELLESICKELLRRLRDKPPSGSNAVFESEGLSFSHRICEVLGESAPAK